MSPPVLASEILEADLMPRCPGRRTIGPVCAASGLAGLVLALALGGASSPLTWVTAGVSALIVGFGLASGARLTYARRAWALAVLGVVELVLGNLAHLRIGLDGAFALLTVGVVVLSAGLLFRSYYRASRLARWVVLAGILLFAGWFAVTDELHALAGLGAAWQSWAPPLVHIAFLFAPILALLAFMDSRTRAGAHMWAYGLLGVFAVDVALSVAERLWPATGVGVALPDPLTATLIASAVGAVATATAAAQLLAVQTRNRAAPQDG
ncbi:MAG: hypothetical protein KC543_01645 [Myxococcales bacterium]|nr:hypothetical protein [Myxococcales bacterium]